jgi:hypothetical protein
MAKLGPIMGPVLPREPSSMTAAHDSAGTLTTMKVAINFINSCEPISEYLRGQLEIYSLVGKIAAHRLYL